LSRQAAGKRIVSDREEAVVFVYNDDYENRRCNPNFARAKREIGERVWG
jgi:hypothetical protein